MIKKLDDEGAQGNSRIIVLSDVVEDRIVGNAIAQILLINEEDENIRNIVKDYEERPIKFIVNTDGGDVRAALALIGVFESSKTPIHTYVYGRAMSAGLLIAIAGHVRYAHYLSTYMYHELSVGNHGKLEQLGRDFKEYSRLMVALDKFILNRTTIDPKRLAKSDTADWYFTAKEALDMGVCDYLMEATYFKPDGTKKPTNPQKPQKQTIPQKPAIPQKKVKRKTKQT